MKNKQMVEKVLNAVKESGHGYRVLSESHGIPVHIRIDGWGDVWTTTATFKFGNKFYKKNYSELCKKLSVTPTPKKESKYQELEKRVQKLEEAVAYLESCLLDDSMSEHFKDGIYVSK